MPFVFASSSTGFPQGNLSPFNDLIVSQLTPVFQADFVYGVLTQLGTSVVVSTGSVVGLPTVGLRVQSGAAADGVGHYESRRPAAYRPGQGILLRFAARYSVGAAASEQFAGAGNNNTDAIGIGYNGTSFGIKHLNNGVTTWIPQASWNGDPVNGSGASGGVLNPQLANVYQVMYPYLGYGNMTLWMQNPATSAWILLHTIQYTNANVVTEFRSPSLHFHAHAENAGNTSNLTVEVGSAGVFVCGQLAYIQSKFAANNNKTPVTTELNILTLRNASSFNGTANHVLLRLRTVSLAYTNGGNGIATIRFVLGATLGGTPSYTPVSGSTVDNGVTITSGQSAASVDVAGTTRAGGAILSNFVATNQVSYLADLTPYNIFVGPNETLTVSATATDAGQIGAALTWDESN